MPPKDKYTDPKLRDEVKQELQDSDKGGAPGQWSARKAQMMASEYKKRGGGYNTDKESGQDDSGKNLEKWGEEEWQTKEGEGKAKQEDGTEKRYLPKKAWEKMSEGEKEETEEKKLEGSKGGKQFVGNTGKARESRKEANEEEEEDEEEGKKARERNGKGQKGQGGKGGKGGKNGQKGKNGKKEDADGEEDDDDEEYFDEDGEAEHDDDGEEENTDDDDDDDDDDAEADDDDEDSKPGQKRKANTKQSNGSSKKQKSSEGSNGNAPEGKVGSKHMDADEPAPRGSADRLPKKGQKITWKALPGYVDGEVTEVLTSGKKVDGKDVKASEKDPKIVMKSNSSGKVCVHKPDACFYEDE